MADIQGIEIRWGRWTTGQCMIETGLKNFQAKLVVCLMQPEYSDRFPQVELLIEGRHVWISGKAILEI